jgi:hypothetical protein
MGYDCVSGFEFVATLLVGGGFGFLIGLAVSSWLRRHPDF